jgi:hypothetical protein
MPAPKPSPLCHHVHPTGRRCGSPALRGERFCYFHHPTRRPPQRTKPHITAFELPPLTDREDLQIAFSEILHRIAGNTLDAKRAGLLLQTLAMASANLAAGGFQSGPSQINPDQLMDLIPR